MSIDDKGIYIYNQTFHFQSICLFDGTLTGSEGERRPSKGIYRILKYKQHTHTRGKAIPFGRLTCRTHTQNIHVKPFCLSLSPSPFPFPPSIAFFTFGSNTFSLSALQFRVIVNIKKERKWAREKERERERIFCLLASSSIILLTTRMIITIIIIANIQTGCA